MYGQGQYNQGGWGQPPPGQYNAPPPGNYPPPQQPYGAPPPGQQHYGGQGQWGQQPPPGQYPPPPGNYPPPPQQPYGAPPPVHQPYGGQGQWGHQPPPPPPPGAYPPPQQPYQPAYGTPPPQQNFGPPNQPSLGYGSMQTANIDVIKDVDALRGAMKGFGTDDKKLIAVLAKKDPIQVNTIRVAYNQRLMRDLIKDIEKETSGYFETGLIQIARGPLMGDCYALYDAMKGIGTKEAVLDDILVGRSNADINAIKAEYQRLFSRSLESDLRGDLSGGTEQMYMVIISARRAEDSAPVIPQNIDSDATQLHRNIGNMITKNAAAVCELLFTRNDAQIRAIIQAYQQRFHENLIKNIKSKFSGHMEDALILLLERAINRADAEAERLEDSMAGLGTKDLLLVQRVVRCHWDPNFMHAVSDAYKRKYGKTLVRRIEGETRGDYEKLMVACVQ